MGRLIRYATASTAATALALAGAVGAAPSASASLTVPQDCYAQTFGAEADGAMTTLQVEKGATRRTALTPGNLGYQARDLTGWVSGKGDYWDATHWDYTSWMFGLDGSRLTEITMRERRDGGPISTTFATKTVAATGWSTIRQAVTSSDADVLYGLSATGLYRYNVGFSSVNGTTVNGRTVINDTGWASIKTLAFARTIDIASGKADVLLATTSTGMLLEYVIPRADPTKWGRYVLRTSGWGGFESLNVGGCGTTASDPRKVYLGTTDDGNAWTYYDPNGRDFSGANLGTVGKVATAWTTKSYSK